MTIKSGTLRRAVTVIVVVYWLAIFAATHVPRIPKALQMPGADKWQHTVAYAGLALLIATHRSFGKPLTRRLVLGIAGVVAVYGALDELTQIPVGRHADIMDWLADCLGAVLGLGLYALLKPSLRRRLFSGQPDPQAPEPANDTR